MSPPDTLFHALLRTLQRIFLEQLKRNKLEGFFLSGFEVNRGRNPCPLSLSPSCGTETPSVARLESRKTIEGSGGAQVITLSTCIREEFFRHLCTDDVHTKIVGTGVTETITLKTC